MDQAINLQLMNDSSISYDHVSRELLYLKRYQEALPVLVRVIEIRTGLIAADAYNRRLNAQMWRPIMRLGTVYQKLGQPDKAKETYQMDLNMLTAYRARTGDASLDSSITSLQAELNKQQP
jgi:tetratricopeptide (TPR) repeat protein